MPNRVYIKTYGCQQNEADSERLLGLCLANGYEKANSPEGADLILVNTCAIREHAELKALSNTGRFKALKEENPALILGVCGCMPQQPHRAALLREKYPYVDFWFGPNRIAELAQVLEQVKAARETKHRRIDAVQSFDENPGALCEGQCVERASPFAAYVTVMYGCDNFCTYCVVPYVRGRERSRTPDAIVQEVQDLVSRGYREITLLGQNVNSYGKTLPVPVSFASLLRRLDAIEGDFVLRFMTSHPKDMSHETVDVIAQSRHIAPQIHLPVQSGSDAVLRAMHRVYTRADYQSLCAYIRKQIPHVTLTTDLIIGFPGESEADFEETLKLVCDMRFDNIYSFLYSPRVGTPAASLPDRVPHAIKTARMARLLETHRQIALSLNENYIGKTLRCLVESPSKKNAQMLTARSIEGKLIHFPKTADGVDAIGTFVPLNIVKGEATVLLAAPYQKKG